MFCIARTVELIGVKIAWVVLPSLDSVLSWDSKTLLHMTGIIAT